jgi:hypothetical protein
MPADRLFGIRFSKGGNITNLLNPGNNWVGDLQKGKTGGFRSPFASHALPFAVAEPS